MVRSSGTPRRRALGHMSRIIRSRAEPVTFARPTESKNALDDTTTSLTEHTESVWFFDPDEGVGTVDTGERVNGAIAALTVADDSVNIQLNDRVTHGGVEYEVDTVIGQPVDADADGTASPETSFFIIDMVRRQ